MQSKKNYKIIAIVLLSTIQPKIFAEWNRNSKVQKASKNRGMNMQIKNQ